jgi:hypothetical protein
VDQVEVVVFQAEAFKAVLDRQRGGDGGHDVTGRDLPDAEPELQDPVAVVEGDVGNAHDGAPVLRGVL